MKTYAEYKRLAIKELTGEFPEEIQKEYKKREPNTLYADVYQYTTYDLNLTINSLIMIDLGKLLNNKYENKKTTSLLEAVFEIIAFCLVIHGAFLLHSGFVFIIFGYFIIYKLNNK